MLSIRTVRTAFRFEHAPNAPGEAYCADIHKQRKFAAGLTCFQLTAQLKDVRRLLDDLGCGGGLRVPPRGQLLRGGEGLRLAVHPPADMSTLA